MIIIKFDGFSFFCINLFKLFKPKESFEKNILTNLHEKKLVN